LFTTRTAIRPTLRQIAPVNRPVCVGEVADVNSAIPEQVR
jgi:hypothetical protein